MRTEYVGNIAAVREIEDTIRVTKKYTKGAFTRPAQHPIQGGDFPSRVLTEYYEVYPDTEISWDMPAGVAIDWLWGEVMHIDVLFQYDYRANKATMIVKGSNGVVGELIKGIPNMGKAMTQVERKDRTNGHH